MAKPKKTHEFVIRVTFDKPCGAKLALAGVKDTIHGSFYPFQPDVDKNPGEFWIKSFKPVPQNKR